MLVFVCVTALVFVLPCPNQIQWMPKFVLKNSKNRAMNICLHHLNPIHTALPLFAQERNLLMPHGLKEKTRYHGRFLRQFFPAPD